MTDQDKAQLTPSEQVFADEMTRIANRQMQVVTRLDNIQEKLAQAISAHDAFDDRIDKLEEWHKKPGSLIERVIFPLLIVNLTLTTGNIALTLGVAIALVNHMLAH